MKSLFPPSGFFFFSLFPSGSYGRALTVVCPFFPRWARKAAIFSPRGENPLFFFLSLIGNVPQVLPVFKKTPLTETGGALTFLHRRSKKDLFSPFFLEPREAGRPPLFLPFFFFFFGTSFRGDGEASFYGPFPLGQLSPFLSLTSRDEDNLSDPFRIIVSPLGPPFFSRPRCLFSAGNVFLFSVRYGISFFNQPFWSHLKRLPFLYWFGVFSSLQFERSRGLFWGSSVLPGISPPFSPPRGRDSFSFFQSLSRHSAPLS